MDTTHYKDQPLILIGFSFLEFSFGFSNIITHRHQRNLQSPQTDAKMFFEDDFGLPIDRCEVFEIVT
jgi:hypothetical protein